MLTWYDPQKTSPAFALKKSESIVPVHDGKKQNENKELLVKWNMWRDAYESTNQKWILQEIQ